MQSDAHQYSEKVLANNTSFHEKIRTTPKFERAKLVLNNGHGMIYISGTAAIKGESSITQYDITLQTSLTLDNIYQIASKKNIADYIYSDSMVIKPLYFRVYLKNRKDYKLIETIILAKIGKTPVLFVESDICRKELIVEIEGVFSLQYSLKNLPITKEVN